MRALESFEQQISMLVAPDGYRRAVSVFVAAQDELLLAGCVQLLADAPAVELARSLKLQRSVEEAWELPLPDVDVLVLGVDTLMDKQQPYSLLTPTGRSG